MPQPIKNNTRFFAILVILEISFLAYLRHLNMFFGILFLSALTLLGSGYLAKNWYDTSVQTKQEVREEILQQVKDEGSIIVPKAEYTALRHEKELLKG